MTLMAQTNPEHVIPTQKNLSEEFTHSLYDKSDYIFTGDELKTIGMPVGGIAAGQLYVRGDGSLANWWIANNGYNTGYGIAHLLNFATAQGDWKVCYQTFEPFSYVDQYFEITYKQDGEEVTRRLDKSGFDAIEFRGEYPVAMIDYKDSEDIAPVDVSMRIFSPFVPGELRKSATPATIIKFTVTNNSKRAQEITFGGVLQNMVMRDLMQSATGSSRNVTFSEDGRVGVTFDFVPDDKSLLSHPYSGNMSLVMLDGSAQADADISTMVIDDCVVADQTPQGNSLLGGVRSTVRLARGESRELTYLLTWYFPNRPMNYGDGGNWNQPIPTWGAAIGNMYSNWFDSSEDVASYLDENLQTLSDQTELFRSSWYDQGTLPYWLRQRIMQPVSTLATETCQWWANDKFWSWEGVGSCVGTCTHVWNYSHAQAYLFPELERNVREKTDLGTSFDEASGGVGTRNGSWGGFHIDGHAGAILKMYREHLNSKDNIFLSRNWDKVKKAMEYLIAQDGDDDGLIEGTQPNTYDIAFQGANTYVGSLYLAALRAAQQMALVMGEPELAQRYNSIFESGSALSSDRLWNGEYFFQDVDLEQFPQFQYGNGCLSDQLFGQTWAHLLDLGHLYSAEKVRTALGSIWKYNWTDDVRAHNAKYTPERTYADYGEAGLFICTYPNSRHLDKDAVRYRNEVWTGIEYQVATNMIYDGLTREALAITRSVHDRYNPVKHNPWNEIECGDHYARALASWGLLLALEDYHYDGPCGALRFNPSLDAEDFNGFFTVAQGWGNLTQKISSDGQRNTVELKYGKLELSQISVSLLSGMADVSVVVDGVAVEGFTYEACGDLLVLTLPSQNLRAGSVLEIIQR